MSNPPEAMVRQLDMTRLRPFRRNRLHPATQGSSTAIMSLQFSFSQSIPRRKTLNRTTKFQHDGGHDQPSNSRNCKIKLHITTITSSPHNYASLPFVRSISHNALAMYLNLLMECIWMSHYSSESSFTATPTKNQIGMSHPQCNILTQFQYKSIRFVQYIARRMIILSALPYDCHYKEHSKSIEDEVRISFEPIPSAQYKNAK